MRLGAGFYGCLIAAAAIVGGASTASGQGDEGAELPLSECLDAVGTFLTTNRADGDSGDKFSSRSLLSITNGGHMFFTDSGGSGEAGFAPFSEGRGAWRCVSKEGDVTRLVGTVLDFTYPPAGEEQQIGRLDFDVSFDKVAQSLSGKLVLYFVPLPRDPLDPADLKEGGTGSFTGQRVTAP